MVGYTDAAWAGSAADHRSTSGYTFSLGSAAIACNSKKQPTVALSSTEAKYRGVAVATCEAIWLKRLLKELQEEVLDPTTIYWDNLSSIQLAKNPVIHARTKHIEVHYHFVRERVLSGEVELQYVPTDRQTADIFTKPLGLDKLRQSSGALGLRHLDVPNLRGRRVSRDQAREQERSGRDRDTESDDEFDFGSAEEAEGGSAEESESGHKGSNRRKEPKSTKHGGDEAIKGEKTEDELETANSDDNKNHSKETESVRMFDSDTLNQPMAKRKRRQQEKHQHHNRKRDGKGRVSRQADRKGRSACSRTCGGARVRHGGSRNRSSDPREPEEPQVELEGEC